LYRLMNLIQSDIDWKVHNIAKHTDCEVIILRRSMLSRASGISEIITRYLLPQEVDNSSYFKSMSYDMLQQKSFLRFYFTVNFLINEIIR
jgi:hypothetical protein